MDNYKFFKPSNIKKITFSSKSINLFIRDKYLKDGFKRIFKETVDPNDQTTKIYYEIEWLDRNFTLNKYIQDSMIPYESREYSTEFCIEKIVACEFENLTISFCCVGETKITHFNEKVGYTSRQLPFKISDSYFLKNKIPGILLFSSTPYRNSNYFWLTSSFNDLYPLVLISENTPFLLNSENMFITDYNGESLVFCCLNGVFKLCQLISRQITGQFNDFSASQMAHCSSFNDLSFLNLSKHEQLKLDFFNSHNTSGIFFHGFDISQENSINPVQISKSVAESRIFVSQHEKAFVFVKDAEYSYSVKDINTKFFKSSIIHDFLDRKFLILLYHNKILEVVSMSGLHVKKIDKVVDFTWLPEVKLVFFLVDNSIIAYSGDVCIYTFSYEALSRIQFISARFDKLIFLACGDISIERFYIFDSSNHMISRFWKILKAQNPSESKILYDHFLTFIINHRENCNFSECFSRFMFTFFGVPFESPKFEKKTETRLIYSIRKCEEIYDQFKSYNLDVINHEKRFIFQYIVQFLENFRNKFLYDDMNIKLLENVINRAYLYFNEFKLSVSHSKENKNTSNEVLNIGDRNQSSLVIKNCPPIYHENFSIATVSVNGSGNTLKSNTLFPFNQIDEQLDLKILEKTRGILDWSKVLVVHGASNEMLESTNVTDLLPETEDPIIWQKCYAALQINRILSKPIALGCCNFGVGVRDSCDFSFKCLENNPCFEVKCMIYQKNEFAFPVIAKLEETEINVGVLEQARFHNGVCMAISSIHPLTSEAVLLRKNSDMSSTKITYESSEPWLKQALECFSPSEFGGFAFGCGLIGQLYNLPVDSPGFLLNILLKSSGMSLCGILLGLGASHIMSFKLDSVVLISRLQRTFIIHSGLSPFTTDAGPSINTSTVREIFSIDSAESKICVEAQCSAIISLGLIHFTSGDSLILRILKSYFSSILWSAIDLPAVSSNLKGLISTPRISYNKRIICLVVSISIGLINLKMGQKNEFTWDNFYGSVLRQIEETNNNMVYLLESVYIMIGLTYLRTNNRNAAKLLETPIKWIEKIQVKPIILLISNWFWGLVMNEELVPSYSSIYRNLPSVVKKRVKEKNLQNFDLQDDLTFNSWAVVTGRLYALCVNYAGTFNQKMFKIVRRFIYKLLRLLKVVYNKETHFKDVRSQIYYQCMACLILGICLVFAGSCMPFLKIMIQKLMDLFKPKYYPCEKNSFSYINYYLISIGGDHGYGFHAALQMALGILCLGNGYMSLTTRSIKSFSMLVLSVYPNFPSCSTDNITYFQPLRHFYTLACTRSRVAVLINKDDASEIYKSFKFHVYTNKGGKERELKARFPQAIILPYSFNRIEIDFPNHERIVIDKDKLQEKKKDRVFDLGELHKIVINLTPIDYVLQSFSISPKNPHESLLNFLGKTSKLMFQDSCISRSIMMSYRGRIPISTINTLLDILLAKRISSEKLSTILDYIRVSLDRVFKVANESTRGVDLVNIAYKKEFQLIDECFSLVKQLDVPII